MFLFCTCGSMAVDRKWASSHIYRSTLCQSLIRRKLERKQPNPYLLGNSVGSPLPAARVPPMCVKSSRCGLFSSFHTHHVSMTWIFTVLCVCTHKFLAPCSALNVPTTSLPSSQSSSSCPSGPKPTNTFFRRCSLAHSPSLSWEKALLAWPHMGPPLWAPSQPLALNNW